MKQKLLNMEEACEYTGRSDMTLRKAVKNKEIPCRLFRGGYIFSKNILDLWASGMESQEIQAIIIKSITNELISDFVQIESLARC